MDSKPTYEKLENRIRELEESLIQAEKIKTAFNDSKEGFLSVLEGIEALVYVADMETYEILYANSYIEKLFGEDLQGKICWQELQEGQSGPCDFCTNDRLLTSEGKPAGPYRWEFRNTKTGKWYTVYDLAIKWLDGRIVRLEIAYDITDHKLDEEALRESEAKYQGIFDMSPMAIAVSELNTGRLIDVNKKFCELTEYSPEQVLGKTTTELGFYSETSRNKFIKELRVSGEVQGLEMKFRLKDSSVINDLMFAKVVRVAREKLVITVFYDLTERMQAEEALRESERRLKESQKIARLGQWELDLVTDTLYWSEGIYDLFEIDPEEFGASYEAFLAAIHPDDREFVDNAYTESVKNRTPYDIVHRLLLKDGTIKYVNEICRTEYDEDGNPLRSLGTVQDITERTQAEKERERLTAELQSAFDNIKTLKGLLPICSNCKKIRDDKGYWNKLERYIEKHSDASFSHGLCPECVDKIYGGEEWYKKRKKENTHD